MLLAVVAALAALPVAVGAFPTAGGDPSAATLLARIRATAGRPYSGYAESTGSLALPTSDALDGVDSLLGGRTQVRVWYRSPQDWRADVLTPTGEEATRVMDWGTSVWDYEDNRTTLLGVETAGAVRLPRASDLLPPDLAARLLSEATPAQVVSLASRRVAGREADGLQLRPGDALSSIDRVDVWADRASGVPVHVDVHARGGTAAALSTTFLDFSDATPAVTDTPFSTPSGARVRNGRRFDLVRTVGEVPDSGLPGQLLGLPRAPSPAGLEGIGQYGRGVTQFVVGELPGGQAASLRRALSAAGGATALPEGIAINVGPVGLLLTDEAVTGRTWLLAGTLTSEGLSRAATALRGVSR